MLLPLLQLVYLLPCYTTSSFLMRRQIPSERSFPAANRYAIIYAHLGNYATNTLISPDNFPSLVRNPLFPRSLSTYPLSVE